MSRPYAYPGQVRITCDACKWSWIEEVTVEMDEPMLDNNEEQECPDCGATFDFDLFAGSVTRLYV